MVALRLTEDNAISLILGCVLLYADRIQTELWMIHTFRHRGLKRLYEHSEASKLPPQALNRIENILARLDAADSPKGMDLPGYRLHRLSGELKNFWSVRVTGNYRIIFRFENGAAHDVELLDYH